MVAELKLRRVAVLCSMGRIKPSEKLKMKRMVLSGRHYKTSGGQFVNSSVELM